MAEGHQGRHLAAIVFTDIVNFSAIVHRDEVLGERLLNRQRAVIQQVLPRFGGREIGTAGDSSLIEFDSALAAVSAVVALQQDLARENARHPADVAVTLRISVHLGDVEHRGAKVYGDGVNVAARLMPYSPEGGLCLSASVRALVRQRLPLPLRSIGAPALKNIDEPIELFVVDAGDLLAFPLPTEVMQRPRRNWAWAASALLAVGLLSGLWAIGTFEVIGQGGSESRLVPSIAVLPFENRSPDADNAFFADGIQDEILARLARVGSLKVVSRSSTQAYGPNPQNPRAVALDLGVGHLLQGSVQRVGSRVRINVHLFDPMTQTMRWAELYDRDVTDLLSVQAEVAAQVVEALDAQLAPPDRAVLAELPTRDPGAYDEYLRARFYQLRAESTPANFNSAVHHYERAVALDPSFALAWAQLAFMHSQLYWFDYDATPARLKKAESAAARAAQLQPELGEAYLARGYIRYWGHQDYAGALALFEEARKRLPNDAEVLMAESYVKRRQGEWTAALDLQAQALERDPRNPQSLHQYAVTLMMLPGRLGEALEATERGLNLQPDDPDLLANKVAVLHAQGAVEAAAALMSQHPTDPRQFNLFLSRIQNWLYQRQPAPAIAALRSAIAESDPSLGAGIGLFHVLLVEALRLQGDAAAAREATQAGISALERLRQNDFDSGRIALDLALLRASLGQGRAAQRELAAAEKAFASDQLDGPSVREVRARVEARLGRIAPALDLIEPLLRTTYSSFQYGPPLTPALLQLDPAWDALRADARYLALVDPASLVGRNEAEPALSPGPARR